MYGDESPRAAMPSEMSDISHMDGMKVPGPMNRLRRDEPSEARVTNQLEFMESQIEKTFALVEILEQRITHILIPQEAMPHAPDTDGPEPKMGSAVSNHIDQLNGRLSRIQRHLNLITERVQL